MRAFARLVSVVTALGLLEIGARADLPAMAHSTTETVWSSPTLDVPASPTNLTGSVAGSTVTLNWLAATTGEPPLSFVIEAGSAPGLANVASVDVPSGTTTLTAVSVTNGIYFVRVRARNASGLSTPSNEMSIAVGGLPQACVSVPGAPTGLTAVATGSTLTLRWQAASGGCPASTFVVEAGSVAGFTDLAVVSTGSAVTEFTAQNVGNGTLYLRVRAANTWGSSVSSNEAVVTVGPGPSAEPCPRTTAPQTMPLVVYSEAGDARNRFIPSGFFGDFADVFVALDDRTMPYSGSTSIRIDYRPAGSQRFAGIFWQCPPNNFGTVPGAGLNLSRARQVRFFARASAPGKAEFKVGGIGRNAPRSSFPDSLDATPTNPVLVDLGTSWREYVIDLAGHDLSFVIGGFMFVTSVDQNPNGLTVFLDEIVWR